MKQKNIRAILGDNVFCYQHSYSLLGMYQW